MSVDELIRLKRKVAKHKTDQDQAAGALEQALTHLTQTYNVKDEAEAEKLLKKLRTRANKLEAKYVDGIKQMKAKYDWLE